MHELCTSCPPNLSSCEAAAPVPPPPKLVIVRSSGTCVATTKTCHRVRQRHPCRHHQNLSSCEAAALVSPTPKLVIVRDNGTRAVTIKTCHRSRQRHPCRHHQMRRIKNKKGKKRHLKRPQNQENTIDNRNPVVKSQSRYDEV